LGFAVGAQKFGPLHVQVVLDDARVKGGRSQQFGHGALRRVRAKVALALLKRLRSQ
jgi:hypothetical protein